MSEDQSYLLVNGKNDPIEEYFECITECSLDEERVDCITHCVQVHLKTEVMS